MFKRFRRMYLSKMSSTVEIFFNISEKERQRSFGGLLDLLMTNFSELKDTKSSSSKSNSNI